MFIIIQALSLAPQVRRTVLSWQATRRAQCRRVQKLTFFRSRNMKASHEWSWSNADMTQCPQKRYHFHQENNRARWPTICDNILDLESEGSVFKSRPGHLPSWRTLLVQPNFPSTAAGISVPLFSTHSTTYTVYRIVFTTQQWIKLRLL